MVGTLLFFLENCLVFRKKHPMIIRHPTENRTWEEQKPCVFATSFDNPEAKKKFTLVSRLKCGQKECFTKHPCQWNFKMGSDKLLWLK